jgi:hypothetical protein
MFGGQGQLLAAAAQVEIGVAPTVQFTGTTEGLPGAAGMGVFAGMVNQEHGQVELALQLAQEGEQARDLGRIVFINAMEPNEGIEDQQDRLEGLDRVGQALAIGGGVQAQCGGGDDFHGQRFEADLRRLADPLQPLAHHRQGVFGREEQNLSGALNGKTAQARRAGGDADGDIQSQETFAAFGFAAQNAHRLLGPEVFDQPVGLRSDSIELAGALDGEQVHGFLEGLGSRAKTSKKSFSSI